jgi:hypothetical protein
MLLILRSARVLANHSHASRGSHVAVLCPLTVPVEEFELGRLHIVNSPSTDIGRDFKKVGSDVERQPAGDW